MEIQKETKEFIFVTLGALAINNEISGEIELDVDNSYKLAEVIENELSRGKINFLVEMKHIKYVDSSGFSVMLNCYKQVNERNGIFKILNPSEHVKRVLNIMKIEM